ncbi:MAG: amidohydrolase family protein [Planctomycetaceae bacterium]|nr:amidohydrolase family protein [Planctomycetaceae bacterium]
MIYRVAWLINPGQEPRQNVRISTENGIVTEICDVPPDERSQIQPVAMLPPFVNAHTHLEFSDIRSPLSPAQPFTDWIAAVMAHRRSRTEPADTVTAVRDGLSECRESGVTLIGEISTSDPGRITLREASVADCFNGTVVDFAELIGWSDDRIANQLQFARAHLASGEGGQHFPAGRHSAGDPVVGRRILPGLSPHAPYTVHPELLEGAVSLAAEYGASVAMHIAETADELEFLDRQSGPFRSLLEQVGVYRDGAIGPGTTPLRYLQMLAAAPRALAIHGNWYSDREIQFLAKTPRIVTVYCPRTHRYFGHSPHPWRKLAAAGAAVILGTDSRASNPDLCIWQELQTVAQHAQSPPVWELLSMITTNAATALGFNKDDWTIQVGHKLRAQTLPAPCTTLAQLQHHLSRDLNLNGTSISRQPFL